jgi:hypothetical protein
VVGQPGVFAAVALLRRRRVHLAHVAVVGSRYRHVHILRERVNMVPWLDCCESATSPMDDDGRPGASAPGSRCPGSCTER